MSNIQFIHEVINEIVRTKLSYGLFLCIQMYTIKIHINKSLFKNIYYICVFVNLHLNGRSVKEIYGV